MNPFFINLLVYGRANDLTIRELCELFCACNASLLEYRGKVTVRR